MVTYQLNDWIKAGANLGDESFFKTDQIVPSILKVSKSQYITFSIKKQVFENRKTGFLWKLLFCV